MSGKIIDVTELALTRTEYAKTRTKLANQRTYLAYLRTSLAVAALTATFKQWYIFSFAIFIVIISVFKYYIINDSIEGSIIPEYLNYLPISYSILGILVIYLQFIRKKK